MYITFFFLYSMRYFYLWAVKHRMIWLNCGISFLSIVLFLILIHHIYDTGLFTRNQAIDWYFGVQHLRSKLSVWFRESILRKWIAFCKIWSAKLFILLRSLFCVKSLKHPCLFISVVNRIWPSFFVTEYVQKNTVMDYLM